MKIEINDGGITSRLQKICRSVGGNGEGKFVPIRQPYRPFEFTLAGEEIKQIFHPSGLLILNDQPVFAYIRDHTTGEFPPDPHQRRKVHFSFCRTLEYMKRIDRYESRYHVTNRVDNRYYVDIGSGGYRSRESQEKLYPCQHCLAEIGYSCFDPDDMEFLQKRQIVESFDAKDAMELLRQHFDIFRQRTTRLRPDTVAAGYLPNQGEISKRYRDHKKHICDKCKKEGTQKSTEMHHKDGNKRNNNDDNVQCLCKPCHVAEHPHYWRPKSQSVGRNIALFA